MVGSDEEGDFSLHIKNVNLEDDAKFQCQVMAASNGVKAIRSRTATLTVFTRPKSPEIKDTDLEGQQVHAGKRIELTCEARDGKPPAEVSKSQKR